MIPSVPQPGQIYRHFRGGIYRIVCVAANSENRTEQLVVYFSLKLRVHWVRPLIMFVEDVPLPDAGASGAWGPRFRKLGWLRGLWEQAAHWIWKA